MATRTKRRREQAPDPEIELIVRRGAGGRYRQLKQKTEDLPVEVVWDRRDTERRKAAEAVASDRRNSDRRQKPPFTWDLSDFVVVGKPRHRVKAR